MIMLSIHIPKVTSADEKKQRVVFYLNFLTSAECCIRCVGICFLYN